MKPQDKARKLRPLIEKAAASLADADALDAVELFPAWQSEHAYAADERIRYKDKLYCVVQAHASQDGWTPDVTPSLFAEVSPPGVIPVWRQPIGAQDAYNTGDKVLYPDESGAVYESTIDGNVWSPEAYPAGWRAV